MIPFYLAVHEAGHAMAQWYSGIPFKRVLVRRRADWDTPVTGGRMNGLAFQGTIEGHSIFQAVPGVVVRESADDFATMYRAAEIEILHVLAGPIAEAKKTHRALYLFGGSQDVNHATEIARAIPDRFESDMLKKGIERAKTLFRDTDIWKATLAVADALQDRLSLEWHQVCEIVKEETGLEEQDYGWPLDKTDW
jgi:hypothetical protein